MPERPSPQSLRDMSMEAISANFELICFGCRQRSHVIDLLNSDSEEYKDVEGPFSDMPTSILEDLIKVIGLKRGLPKQCLHQLLIPQLQGYKVHSKTSKHIQTMLIEKNLSKLKNLEFSYCTSIDPTFFIKFFLKLPGLVVLNLEGTIIDDYSFESIGKSCQHLRDLNVRDSTMSNTGLSQLIYSKEDPRVPNLMSIKLEGTKVSSESAADFLKSHPKILTLSIENMSGLFSRLRDITESQKEIYQLRELSFVEGLVDEESLKYSVEACPLAENIVIRQTDLSDGLLSSLHHFSCLKSLHLGNSSYSQHSIHFQGGIVPVLANLPGLTSLTLEKINRVDVAVIGDLCQHLKYLKLSCIGSYLPVISADYAKFEELTELIILNTRGAHVYTKIIFHLVSCAKQMEHLRFQLVDTLNDEVWNEMLLLNPLTNLQTVVLDQCHSVSIFTLSSFITSMNKLSELCVWSCRFIMEDDYFTIMNMISIENYELHFNWYPYTGEEAPMPLDDIEHFFEEEEEDEFDEDDEENIPDFLNYWNNVPLPGSNAYREMQQLNLD